MQRNNKKTLALMLGMAFVQTVAAQGAGEEKQLQAVHVTSATGRSQVIEDVQASVQVISARDLEAYPGTSVTEALKLAVGVDARPNGPTSSVTMRGIASSGTLILIDGDRRTNRYGSQNLNMLATEDVERIEIVRGPMSALYGADASGGVINIITKKAPLGSGLSGSAGVMLGTASAGQRSTNVERVSVAYGGDQVGHRLTLENRSMGDFRYAPTSYLTDLANTSEQYVNYSGQAKLGVNHLLHWRLEYVDQDDTKPDRTTAAPIQDFTGFERERRDYYKLGYVGSIGPGVLTLDASYGKSDGKTTRAYPTIETTDYRQKQYAGRYAAEFGAHAVTVGMGQITDELDVSLNSQKGNRRDEYVLLQDEWRMSPQWKLLAGLRHDKFNEFGAVNTPRVSLMYQPDGVWSFRAGYGKAYRAPTVLEQYSRFTRQRFLILGNANLKPESNQTNELAAAYRSGRLQGELVAYRSRVSDMITTVTSPALPGDPAGVTLRSNYVNVSSARVTGVELSGSYQVTHQLAATGGLEWLDVIDANSGARLTGRARNTAKLGLRYEQGAWSGDLLARYQQFYYNADSVTRVNTSTAYGTTDIRVNYRVSKALTTSFGIENLFDRRPPGNWSTTEPPARFAYVSARYAF